MSLLESFEKWGCSRVCQVGEGRRGERGESKRTCSLWTIPWWWRQLTASRTERMTVVASFWVDSTFARIRSKALRRCQKRVVFYARLEALRDRRCWWGGRLCPDADFVSFWGWRYNLVLTYCPINAEKACERSGCWNIDWGLRPREVVRKNHWKVPHVTVAVLCKSMQTREEVEAPLDIKDVIHQISCFLKTIVMNITLSSVGRTSVLQKPSRTLVWLGIKCIPLQTNE